MVKSYERCREDDCGSGNCSCGHQSSDDWSPSVAEERADFDSNAGTPSEPADAPEERGSSGFVMLCIYAVIVFVAFGLIVTAIILFFTT